MDWLLPNSSKLEEQSSSKLIICVPIIMLTLIVKAPLSTETDLSLESVVDAVNPLFKDEQGVSRTRFERFEIFADCDLVFTRLGKLLESNHGEEYHSWVD
jgi:hypothetical protein